MVRGTQTGSFYTALTAIALIVGTVVGAGILGLPYVFAKAGFWAGIINLIVIGSASTLLTLYVLELSLRTKEKHHLAGFAMKYLGPKWKYVILLAETIGIYAVLIAYLTGIGMALSNLFGGSALLWSTLFFVLASPIVYVGLKTLSTMEFIITSAKILIVIGVILALFPSVNPTHLQTTFNFSTLFIPFGIVLFATLGYTIIPEIEELMADNKKKIKDVVLIAMGIVLAIYALFAFVFVGNFGTGINNMATISLSGNLEIFGDLFMLLTMITPFIAMSTVVKDVYCDDFRLDRRLSWFLAAFIPFMLFLYLDLDFVTLIGISGTYAFGFMGVMTGFMVINARKQKPEVKPEFIVPGGSIPVFLTILVFIGGIVYQTALMLGLI
jgi:amino acid permease